MVDLGFVGPSRPTQDYRFVKVTDGDTPTIEMSIRMVSIDTPESEFGGSPPTAQATLDRTKERLQDGTYNALPEDLRDYLIARITPDAAQRHLSAGKLASEAHKTMVTTRLTRPNGSQRKLAVLAPENRWRKTGGCSPAPPRGSPARPPTRCRRVTTPTGERGHRAGRGP